uniref:Uncharacterized protein n=1 Tax=Arundo donax TaxID=35708 RepID=A0A0A9FTL5_ARUDO
MAVRILPLYLKYRSEPSKEPSTNYYFFPFLRTRDDSSSR